MITSIGTPPAVRVETRPALDTILISLLMAVILLNPGIERVVGVSIMAAVTIAVFLSVAVTWLIARKSQSAGSWLLVLTLAGIIVCVSLLASRLAILALLVLPTALAVALLDMRSATSFALLQTLVVLQTTRPASAEQATVITVCLLATWAVFGVMAAVYAAVHDVTHWSWQHYLMAVQLLDQDRQRKQELEQTLQDLAHANQQLALINERLAIARRVAEDAEKTKASFVANVSHEFRTPLNMIIGVVDLLLETPQIYGQALPQTLMADLDIVKRNCEHLSSMIDDVLDLSQIEAGRLALHRERVSLGDIIRRSLAVIRPLVQAKNLQLSVHIAENLPEAYCDRTRIRQVVLNLLSNAARYTDRGGITLNAVLQGQFVRISVQDTGPGIKPEDAKYVFEPFYQGRTGRLSQQKGSGLGLSISKEFVELHGGRMSLESKPGEGSTFSFVLPISPPLESSLPAHRWLREDWIWMEHSGTRPIKVPAAKPCLMVFDQTGELSPILARYAEDMDVHTAKDMSEATAAAEAKSCAALIINGASMMDANALVERARMILQDIPVIGCSLPQRAEHAMATGAQDYLLKPVKRASLAAVLDHAASPIRRVLVVDDEPDARRLLGRMLHACNAGLQIEMADTGADALQKMRDLATDLVLLDIILPDMDGWRVLAHKTADPQIRSLPTVLLSAQDPRDKPIGTPIIAAAMGEVLSIGKLLTCVKILAAVLPRSD